MWELNPINLMDHRGSSQSKVLVEETVTSSDCISFSRAALGNNLLHSQQAELLYSKFSPAMQIPVG